ncbi:hypothetical protein BC831DRAFT_474090 [Entophlyctis helioformis]|nr:hypothetical protein BC831DRAFT_474090 [Entophlyctis helioformis]
MLVHTPISSHRQPAATLLPLDHLCLQNIRQHLQRLPPHLHRPRPRPRRGGRPDLSPHPHPLRFPPPTSPFLPARRPPTPATTTPATTDLAITLPCPSNARRIIRRRCTNSSTSSSSIQAMPSWSPPCRCSSRADSGSRRSAIPPRCRCCRIRWACRCPCPCPVCAYRRRPSLPSSTNSSRAALSSGCRRSPSWPMRSQALIRRLLIDQETQLLRTSEVHLRLLRQQQVRPPCTANSSRQPSIRTCGGKTAELSGCWRGGCWLRPAPPARTRMNVCLSVCLNGWLTDPLPLCNTLVPAGNRRRSRASTGLRCSTPPFRKSRLLPTRPATPPRFIPSRIPCRVPCPRRPALPLLLPMTATTVTTSSRPRITSSRTSSTSTRPSPRSRPVSFKWFSRRTSKSPIAPSQTRLAQAMATTTTITTTTTTSSSKADRPAAMVTTTPPRPQVPCSRLIACRPCRRPSPRSRLPMPSNPPNPPPPQRHRSCRTCLHSRPTLTLTQPTANSASPPTSPAIQARHRPTRPASPCPRPRHPHLPSRSTASW